MNELLESIGLPSTSENLLYVNSAIEWLNLHTVYHVSAEDTDSLIWAVRLFILKYSQLMTISAGVASESISGLSQSFSSGQSLESKIYELATALLGSDCLKSNVTVYSGEDSWNYGR